MIPLRDVNPIRITPWVTWGTILVCALVFLWQLTLPDPVARDFVFSWGLVPRRLAYYSDPQAALTVLTSMFMHGGWSHVLGNLWFLYIFGDNVEEHLGHGRFALFYVLSGLAAAAAQIAIDPTSPVPMVGASGAIAGVLAAYLVLYPRARVVTVIPIVIFLHFTELPAVVFIVLWFVFQFFAGVGSLGATGGGVAYWAHIGGFVAGLVMILLMRRPPSGGDWRAPHEVDWYRPRRRDPPWRDHGW